MNRPGTEPLRPADPAQIGPYQLLGRLGEGGMGTVYLALAPTERPVAIKVVKPELTVDASFAARFHAEVENARRVASFCTAQVLDNGNTEDGRPYMVTEYIPGTPLSAQIATYGALDPGQLHGVALGVAAALAAIHVAGLVHRDLKPSNVILSMSGPRVIDFGISRALDAASSFTQSGELLGSPGWWAPEQVRGDAITPAADIFAWGCLVAYSGNGRHPYGRGDALTLAARVLNTPPDLGALPVPLNDLVRRATHSDPARRPSAQELLIALVSGGVPNPQPLPVEPATLVATEILNESWQPPANVADEPPGAPVADAPPAIDDTGDDTGGGVPSGGPHTDPGGDPKIGDEPAVSTMPGAATAPGGATVPSRSAEPPASYTPPKPEPSAAFGHPPITELPTAITNLSAPHEPRPARRPIRSWLIPTAAIVAALAVTVGVLGLVRNAPENPEKMVQAGDSRFAGEQRFADGPETDIGRRVTLGDRDVQALIPQPPTCADARCTVRLSLVNTGGAAIPIPRSPRLVDDQGGGHNLRAESTELPDALAPGDKIDAMLVFDIPSDRKPAKLVLAEGIEVRL